MSGKIILKRKQREADPGQSSADAPSAELPNTSCKRQCSTETPQPQPQPPPKPTENPRNQLLIEALKRIVELQSELDAFEQDLEEQERNQLPHYVVDDDSAEVSMYPDEVAELQRQVGGMGNLQRSEAEALGFAMCARETLLFLEREGVPADSLLYRSLRSKLVGQTDGYIPI